MADKEPKINHYDYLYNMSVEGWTWEFIRRCPAYHKGWKRYSSRIDIEQNHLELSKIDRHEIKAASRFGLLFFADPAQDSKTISPFWSPSHNPYILKCTPTPNDKADNSSGALLNDIACKRSLVQSSDGKLHLLLSKTNRSLQLTFDKKIDIEQEVYFEIRVRAAATLIQQAAAISCLDSLLTQGSFARSYSEMPARLRIKPQLLYALDLAKLGFSQREIAQRIFGEDAVLTGWNGISHHIKSRTYRLLKKGKKLIGKSHKVLLNNCKKRK